MKVTGEKLSGISKPPRWALRSAGKSWLLCSTELPSPVGAVGLPQAAWPMASIFSRLRLHC